MSTLNPEGHLNVYVRDQESVVTGYGTHDRVVCFQPGIDGLYMRIDHKWGLGIPSVSQMLTVARKDQGIRGKWRLSSVLTWGDGKHTDVMFVRVL